MKTTRQRSRPSAAVTNATKLPPGAERGERRRNILREEQPGARGQAAGLFPVMSRPGIPRGLVYPLPVWRPLVIFQFLERRAGVTHRAGGPTAAGQQQGSSRGEGRSAGSTNEAPASR